jgi:hypothetical protein
MISKQCNVSLLTLVSRLPTLCLRRGDFAWQLFHMLSDDAPLWSLKVQTR